MKKSFFALFVSVCSLIVSLSGSAQILTKNFPFEDVVKLIKSPHDGAVLVEYKSSVDSTVISRVDKNVITPFVRKKGYPHLAEFNIMQDGDIVGSIGDTLYKFWVSGAPETKLLSGKNICPLSINGLKMILCLSDGNNRNIVNYDWVNKVIIDTLEVQLGDGYPFIWHYGGVGEYFYYSLNNWPEPSTIKRYHWHNYASEIVSDSGLVQQYGYHGRIAHSSDARFAYASMQRDTVFVTFVSSDTSIIQYFRPKEGYNQLFFDQGPDNELVGTVADNSIVFVGDSVGSWNHRYDPVSSNWAWSGKYLLNEWDETDFRQYLSVFIGEYQFTIFNIDNKNPIQQAIETKNVVYGLQANTDHYELWYYDLCSDILTVNTVTDQTYFSAKEIRIQGQFSCEVPTLFEASRSINFVPVAGTDSSLGGSYEFKIGSGCPTN